MKSLQAKKLIALSLMVVAPLGFVLAQSAFAGDGQAPALIDKDFEIAVRKFVSKRFYHRIDANEEQRQKLDSIWTSTMDSTRPKREQLRQGFVDLSNLMESENATDDQITQKAHELRALHEKIGDERLESILKARKVLTVEQRKKVHDRILERLTGGDSLRGRKLGLLLPALRNELAGDIE
jgi:Spy/CpxP family protein refolding chaperone